MRYIFKVLSLGDSNLGLQLIKTGKLNHQFKDHEISRWNRGVNVGTDQAVIDIDVVLSSTVDFDSIIPTSDGILYFLDPNDVQQFELFELIIDIIQKLGRTIPIIVVFYTRSGLIYVPSNFLLEYIWENYLIEAFVFDFYSKNTFYEVLECLSEAMITGNIPINVETAWMRIPFFMEKINRLLVDERYEDAGNLAEILTNMKKKFSKQDYFINAEQAAWLYYKSGEYLKASTVLQGVSVYSEKFVRIYVENLVHQGSRLFNMKRYHTAAEKFEKAYLYASIELNDEELAEKSLKLAITTWITSTEFQNAFQLMEKLDFKEQKELMQDLTPGIARAVDRLIEEKRYDIVKGQLYFTIDKYQRMGLFDEIKILGEKIVIVLRILLNQYIKENDPDSANLTLEELFNIWETFHIDREDVDDSIRSIAILFLNKNQFSIVDKLINYVQSYPIQKELTELRQSAEEEYRKNRIDSAITHYTNAISVLKKYVEKEKTEFIQANEKLYRQIEELKKADKILEATSEIKKRADWFKNVGHAKINNELLIHLLDLYLDSGMFLPFLHEMINLRNETREDYLKRSIGKIQNKIEILTESEESLDKVNQILENYAKLYRNHLLYDETKDLERLYVKFLTGRAKKLLATSSGLEEAQTVLDLLKQAEMVYQRLSERDPLDYDFILEEIAQRHLSQMENKLKEKELTNSTGSKLGLDEAFLKDILKELSETSLINSKIKNKGIQKRIHKKIDAIEEEINKERKAEKMRDEEIHMMVEKLSRLRQMAQEELLRQQDTLSRRQGYKRLNYQEFLNLLDNKNYDKALEGYEKQMGSLLSQRKMDLAEIDLAVITILFFILKNKEGLIPLRKKYNRTQGFVSQVVDFIITLLDYPDQSIHLQAIKLFENLALFREEKNALHEIVKPDKREGEKVQPDQFDPSHISEVIINKHIEKLKTKEISSIKRGTLLDKYWLDANNNIRTQNYTDAAREYFNSIDLLIKNDHEEFFPISLMMGVICLLKVGKRLEAKRNLEKTIMEVPLPRDIIQNKPEYKLLEALLVSHQLQDEEKVDLILEAFYKYLPLLDVERGLLLNEISPSKRTEINKIQFEKKQEETESMVLQKQQLSILNKRKAEDKERLEDSFRKRNALKRLVYRNLLEALKNKEYQKAASEYFDLAINQTAKRDYDTVSVLVLLGALSLLKSSVTIDPIKSYLYNFLGRIGFAEKVLKETFPVKLLSLYIDARAINYSSMINSAWSLLQIIPVFEEEKILFEK
ncbi:MAG: hypothetical protein JW776_10240 [Candidatus Lokiarchaeota archaeon]|nr:hypothetical protein [Candidatus Lokiarchaeota archaeon]